MKVFGKGPARYMPVIVVAAVEPRPRWYRVPFAFRPTMHMPAARGSAALKISPVTGPN